MRQVFPTIRNFANDLKSGVMAALIASFLVGINGFDKNALAAPKVTASIAPIHSIAAFIMGDIATPDLLVPASMSPHDFALKPSQALLLENSDLVIWVGHELETFLEKPLETIASGSNILTLIDLGGMKRLEARTDEAFEAAHEDHDHGHDEVKHDDHGHDHHEGTDPHIWLSLANAKATAAAITEQLSILDAANSETYKQNHKAFVEELDQLNSRLAVELADVKNRAYLVYHDAYQYFEDDFGLRASGVFSLNPEMRPGAKKLKDLSKTLADQNIVCIFSEPQFSTKSMELLIAENPELTINTGVLDPLGSDFEIGPKHYLQTINAMSDAFVKCLK